MWVETAKTQLVYGFRPGIPCCHRICSCVLLLLLFSGINSGCSNPFLPTTGVPQVDSRFRRTPEGVIAQLVSAYKQKHIGLFRDLLAPPEQFRSYIAPNVIQELELNNLQRVASTEIINQKFPFIDSGASYSYISYDTEMRIHRQLFLASEITFMTPLNADYIEHVVRPTTQKTDDGRDSVTYDTIAAGIMTEGATVQITADRLEQTTGQRTVSFDIGRQVFYLERDARDSTLWVLVKWFELL